MAFTQGQLDSLEKAIAQGVRSVRHGDETTEFSSLNEMLKLRDIMRAELGQKPASSTTVGKYRSGLRNGDGGAFGRNC